MAEYRVEIAGSTFAANLSGITLCEMLNEDIENDKRMPPHLKTDALDKLYSLAGVLVEYEKWKENDNERLS